MLPLSTHHSQVWLVAMGNKARFFLSDSFDKEGPQSYIVLYARNINTLSQNEKIHQANKMHVVNRVPKTL